MCPSVLTSSPSSLLSDGLRLLNNFFDCSNHVERLLRKIVVFAVNNLTEASNRIFQFHILSLQARKLFGYVERLREEPLNLSSARDNQLIFVGQFIETQNRNDVLQIFVTLQYSFHILCCVVVLFTQDSRIENS